jgi:hypothetical protein
MTGKLSHAAQSGQHPHRDRGLDCYSTPPVAVDALLAVESLPHRIWEPAAGHGNIVRVLREAGHQIYASDIQHYDFPLDGEADFLKTTHAPPRTEMILTNPPYQYATEFVEHALELCPRVIMLCRLAFLESRRRSGILDGGALVAVHTFIERLPMMHRDQWQGPRASSAVPFAWFVWWRDHNAPATVDRISCVILNSCNSRIAKPKRFSSANDPNGSERRRCTISNIIKKTAVADGFEGYEDGVEGHERPQGAGVIQGVLVKFINEGTWETRDGDTIDGDLELIAVGLERVVQKWQDGKPIETKILEPGEKFPDVEALNAEVPQSEWVEGPTGEKRGPWQAQHVLYLLDPTTMDKFTVATGTTGGRIGIGELRDKIVWMRRTRGPSVHAVVTLGDKFMKTRFGGRQRPDFRIVRWVRLGGEGSGEVAALLAPTPAPTLQPVQEPTLAEDFNDDLPDDLAPPKPVKASKAAPNRKLSKSEAA